MPYQLLATDMDGTLLNSEKQISVGNIAAINRALDAGKVVVFSTGRSIAELKHFFAYFPKMRYCICESGALLYDIQEQRALAHFPLDPQATREILDYAVQQDVMIQILANHLAIMKLADVHNLAHFCMAQYQEHFDSYGFAVENGVKYFYENGWDCDKICIYHPSPASRATTRAHIQHLPVTLADAEETSLEISPAGIDKGIGLHLLCKHLGISVAETIVIGDSFNDVAILKEAGLSIAVANAKPEILSLCDNVVADCNDDGVAQAINEFLMA